MRIRLHDDLATFAELALPLLQADPVRHTFAITLLTARLRPNAPEDLARMLTVHGHDGLQGVALQAKGWPLIVSALPAELAAAVADVLVECARDLPGVGGPRPEAEAFAQAWQARTGCGRHSGMDQRLFALGRLTPPAGVPGVARIAGLDDVELLVKWRHEFAQAAVPAAWPRPDDPVGMVVGHIEAGHANVLWQEDGEPVAYAAASAPVAGMSRIGPVWTPPRHRNRGFGSAVTAAASQWALAAGAENVVLFTDLSNPVSNSIYQKIGYRPMYDAVELMFSA